jgi:UDP:flavonoid glycosyltransferase YjiC (YdhE family)
MKITFLTIGSRGDVQPYIALGSGLQSAGHTVRLATFTGFRELVTASGIEFFPVTPFSSILTQSPAWQAWQRSDNHPAAQAWHFGHIIRLAKRALDQVLAEFWKACQGTDVVISGLTGIGGPDIAEKLNVPHCWALLQPMSRTRDFPHLLSPESPPHLNMLTHMCGEKVYWWVCKRSINHLRRCDLRVSQRAKPGPYQFLGQAGTPLLYGYSPILVNKPTDWGTRIHIVGYWFLDRAADWRAPAALSDFLNAGPPPVYVGLDQISHDPAHLEMTLAALERTQDRAILMIEAHDVQQADLPPWALKIESVPHDWLFPKVVAIVHHGGAGTTASALRAGVPSVGIPCFFDQPFWSQRIADIGVGPQPIHLKQLAVDRLEAAIHVMTGDSEVRARASRIGEQIRSEDGVRQAVEILEHYFGNCT